MSGPDGTVMNTVYKRDPLAIIDKTNAALGHMNWRGYEYQAFSDVLVIHARTNRLEESGALLLFDPRYVRGASMLGTLEFFIASSNDTSVPREIICDGDTIVIARNSHEGTSPGCVISCRDLDMFQRFNYGHDAFHLKQHLGVGVRCLPIRESAALLKELSPCNLTWWSSSTFFGSEFVMRVDSPKRRGYIILRAARYVDLPKHVSNATFRSLRDSDSDWIGDRFGAHESEIPPVPGYHCGPIGNELIIIESGTSRYCVLADGVGFEDKIQFPPSMGLNLVR